MSSDIKIPGPEVGYTDLIDSCIDDAESAVEEREYFPLRPSSAGKCARALAYELAEYEGRETFAGEVKAPNVVRLLSLGHSVEYSAITFFNKLKEDFNIEVKYKQQVVTVFTLDDGTIIEGSNDLALVGPGIKAVVDVKSFKDGFSKSFGTRLDETMAKYNKLKTLVNVSPTAWYAPDTAKFVEEIGIDDFLTDNILQLNLYLLSDFFQDRGFDHGVIYKYCKNDSRHYEIRFAPSKELKEMVRDKYNQVKLSTNPEDVGKTFFLGSMRCSFCPYSNRCWGDTDAKKAYFKNLGPKAWPTDIWKIENRRDEIEKLFSEFIKISEATDEKTKIESKLAEILYEQKIKKIRLSDGNIFEVKLLKSPREHFEIRRSKI